MGSGLAFRQFSHGCFHEYLRFLFETSLHSARRPLDGQACGSCYVPCVLLLDPLVSVWAIRHRFSAGRPLDLLVGVPAHLLCYPASVSGTSYSSRTLGHMQPPEQLADWCQDSNTLKRPALLLGPGTPRRPGVCCTWFTKSPLFCYFVPVAQI